MTEQNNINNNTDNENENRNENIINTDEKEKTMDLILNIMTNKYNLFYERTSYIDNKSIGAITFHGAVIFITSFSKLNKYYTMDSSNLLESIYIVISFIMPLIILITSFLSILFLLIALKSNDIKFFPDAICDEQYYNAEPNMLKKDILAAYLDIEEHNKKVLETKHNIYNRAINCSIINLIAITINILIMIL